VIIQKTKQIKCDECMYARADKSACGNTSGYDINKMRVGNAKVKWVPIECGNPDSEYYLALLNAGINGARHGSVTWSGCSWGKRGMCDDC
jgi:hypothetical protein